MKDKADLTPKIQQTYCFNIWDRELARVEYNSMYLNTQAIAELVRKKNPNDIKTVTLYDSIPERVLWLRALFMDMDKKIAAKESENSTLQMTILKLHLENEKLKEKVNELMQLL